MESRHGNQAKVRRALAKKTGATDKDPLPKGVDLPEDYLGMVAEIFTTNFDDGLALMRKIKKDSAFVAFGQVFPNEIVLSLSLRHPGQLAATTAYASVDFDPKASSPTAEELLSACVDGLGTFFSEYLDPKHPELIEKLADETLSALEEAPFDWTPVAVEKHKIYLKVDKANLELDRLADEWLMKNDPDLEQLEEEEHEETQKLFVTGDSVKKGMKH